MVRKLRHNRAHDYKFLVRRWRAVARETGWTMRKFAEASGFELFYLENPVEQKDGREPSIYLSAGIHGDEPGATEGLLLWAQKNAAALRKMRGLIFPCLNPWGITGNVRLNAEGRDLNRSFHDNNMPQIAAQNKILKGRRFDLAITLHEDYDATGYYLYEVPGPKPHWGEDFIRAAGKILPIESRGKIEGRAAKDGIVRRAIKPKLMPTWPEAFVLYFCHCKRVFTVESPSEFHLDDRVDAHVAVIERAISLCRKEIALRARQKA